MKNPDSTPAHKALTGNLYSTGARGRPYTIWRRTVIKENRKFVQELRRIVQELKQSGRK